ncbi:MAG: hypothetical protein KKA79_01490 [Nanoarchaeota archaeon]|nr:hypothetical protein [Nanoarchaeota archaeon]MCG2718680.1 hypothetical protein [Nanoarchaeota archaeon]
MSLKDLYNKGRKKVGDLKEEVDKRGGMEKITEEYMNKGKKAAKRAAITGTKVATSTTAKVAYKAAAGTLTGTKAVMAAKIGKWLNDNYPTVIDNMDDRHKTGAKWGIVTAHLLGKAKDGISERINRARNGLEEKRKQFTLEEAIPELYIAVGLADKFVDDKGTMEDREYEMGDGVLYLINKIEGRFDVKTNNPSNGRNLNITYNIRNEEDIDALRAEMKTLFDDLVLRVEEYNDPALKSFGKTARKIEIADKKSYTSTFSKKDHNLVFEYALKKQGFGKGPSNIYFTGQGIDTRQPEEVE